MLSAQAASGHAVPLSVRVVTDQPVLRELAPQWEELAQRSPEAGAFSTPAAVLSWYRHVEQRSDVCVVTVWSADELVGLAPFSVIRLGPFHLYSTAGAGFGSFGAPLLGASPEPVARVLADHLGELVSKGTAAVYLRRLPENSALQRALSRRGDVRCLPMGAAEVNSVVRFDQVSDPEEYFARVARKHAVPRRIRRLAERFGHIEYLVDDQELDLALDTMRDMLRRRFSTDLRIFSSTSNRALTRELVHTLSADGHARVSCLVADGKRITVTIDLNIGTRVFWYAVAHEPDLAEYSLGHVELYKFLRNAHSTGVNEVDLGSADFAYKRRWATTESRYRTVAITAPGLRGWTANNLRRAVIKLHRTDVLGHHSKGGLNVL